MAAKVKYEYTSDKNFLLERTCSLCNCPFIEPVCTTCQHTFCRQCIMEWLTKNNKSCPTCRKQLTSKDVLPAPFIIHNMVDSLPVRCIDCGQTCIQRKQFQNHIDEICPKAVVNCTAVDVRCPWVGRAKEVELHLKTCAYNQIRSVLNPLIAENTNLKLKNEELLNQSLIDKTKINELQDQITFLTDMITHRNQGLESMLQSQSKGDVIDLRTKRLNNIDMMIVVQKGLMGSSCAALELQTNNITSHGVLVLIPGIINSKSLTKLNLGHNPIGDDGVHLLVAALSSGKSNIQKLHLANIGMTDNGVEPIAKLLESNKKLTSLSLFRNQITDRGVKILSDVLVHHNRTLIGIYLQQNESITDESVPYIAAMIVQNPSLQAIDFENCSLTLNGIKVLKNACMRNTKISVAV